MGDLWEGSNGQFLIVQMELLILEKVWSFMLAALGDENVSSMLTAS